jgi:hypothetical protein
MWSELVCWSTQIIADTAVHVEYMGTLQGIKL